MVNNVLTFNSINKVSLNELYNNLYNAINSQVLANIMNEKKYLDSELEGSYMVAFPKLEMPSITDINFVDTPSAILIKNIKKELRKLRSSHIYVSKISYKTAKYFFLLLENLRKNYKKIARS